MLNKQTGEATMKQQQQILDPTYKLFDVMYELRHSGVVLGLISESGHGKTWRVEDWAKRKDLKLTKVLLKGYSYDELWGIPKVINESDRLTFFKPDWLHENEPQVLFFDEVDKADDEMFGMILTLITNRTVRKWKLHPDSVIILAANNFKNQYSEEFKALTNRVVWYSPNGWDYIVNKYPHLSHVKALTKEFDKLPVSEELSPRLFDFIMSNLKLFVKHDILDLILAGTCSNKWLTFFKENIVDKQDENVNLIIDLVNEDPKYLFKCNLATLKTLWTNHIDKLSIKTLPAFLYVFKNELTADEVRQLLELQANYAQSLIDKQGYADIFIEDDDDLIAQVIDEISDENLDKAFKEHYTPMIDKVKKRKTTRKKNDANV
jgi:hypothetical protein